MFGFFYCFLEDGVGLFDWFYVVNLFDFWLYKELVLIFVHYFIYYNGGLHCKVPILSTGLEIAG